MRTFFYLAFSALAAVAAVARENPFNIPSAGYEFAAGESTTLSWDPTTEGTVTLKLQWGDVLTASTGTTIVSGLPNSGSYIWSVPADIADHDDYTVEIVSDSDPDSANYLPRFSVEGAEAITTTASSTTTTETSTSTSTTETSTTETSTTETTTTSSTTSTQSPTPTSTTSTTTTSPTSTTTTTSSTTTESATETPTSVPNVNDDEDGGMVNRVSGSMLALALVVVAVI